MAQQEQKYKIIISTKLAKKLLKKNFNIIDIKPNNKYPERTVFMFENTPELIKAINDA